MVRQAARIVIVDDEDRPTEFSEDEPIADFTGSGVVTNITFTKARKMFCVLSRGGVSRVSTSVTPNASLGIYCDDGVPTYIPVASQVLHIYAPGTATVSVWGLS